MNYAYNKVKYQERTLCNIVNFCPTLILYYGNMWSLENML